ncbi:hypothetical protein G9A89_021964 [Geosiphon pyriformis]|nr:hypothetical protein G9A89_021964 [Geosiphon pyriformis]
MTVLSSPQLDLLSMFKYMPSEPSLTKKMSLSSPECLTLPKTTFLFWEKEPPAGLWIVLLGAFFLDILLSEAAFKSMIKGLLATVDCSIAVIKKSVKSFGHVNNKEDAKVDVASRKKRKDGVLKDGTASELVLFEKAVSSSLGSEAGNTTGSDNVDIKEECLIEKTSVNYGERNLFIKGNFNQTLKDPRLVTKKALSMSLRKINFLNNVDDDNVTHKI